MDTILQTDGENGSEGIVRCIHFHDYWSVQNSLCKSQSGSEGFLEGVEGFLTLVRLDPWRVLVCQTRQWNRKIGVVRNKSSIEVGKL